MSIKPTYIITGMDLQNCAYDDDVTIEFKSEAAAISYAKKEVATLGDDEQIWVWRLSHVVGKEAETYVESVS